MSVTMKDVAKLAGVSLSTVSRVLNNSSLVKEETASRVKEAVEKLDYKLNDSARLLRTNTSNLIGIIGAGMEHPFLANVLKSIEATAIEYNYSLIYGDSDGEFERELNYLDIMTKKKVDGVIVFSANIYTTLITKIKKAEIPFVFASGHVTDKDINCVTVDNVAAAYDVIEYFLDHQYQHIGIIRGPYSDVTASEERMKGVRLGFKLNQKQLIDEMIIEGDFTFKSGYTGAEKLLDRNKNLSAIFAFNDEMAIGAMKCIQDKGKKIPDDIAVMGFDGIELGKYITPTLSTVSQSGYELGTKSLEVLISIIENEDISPKKVFIPHQLILRESTK